MIGTVEWSYAYFPPLWGKPEFHHLIVGATMPSIYPKQWGKNDLHYILPFMAAIQKDLPAYTRLEKLKEKFNF